LALSKKGQAVRSLKDLESFLEKFQEEVLAELKNNMQTLDSALHGLIILINEYKNKDTASYKQLMQFVSRELKGYSENEDVPEYRKIKSDEVFYSGIASDGTQIKNKQLPIEWIKKNNRLDTHIEREPVVILVENSKQGNYVDIDAGELATDIEQSFGIQCYNVIQRFNCKTYLEMIADIKNAISKQVSFTQQEKQKTNLKETVITRSCSIVTSTKCIKLLREKSKVNKNKNDKVAK
jgi:hypothetical protein